MANALESELNYAFGDALPDSGRTLPVAEGIRWLRMRLPFALDHINLWLLRDHEDTPEGRREGWAIVDCGIDNEGTRAAWEQVFANELQGLPVLRVIVTHMHPDHLGLGHWLTERWGVRLWISATDYNVARVASGIPGAGGVSSARFMQSHGVTTRRRWPRRCKRTHQPTTPAWCRRCPTQYRRLMDGMTNCASARTTWQCIAGYGHAPEHIVAAQPCPES
jgi:glyoxylase-like metal-dependent hydrolase (beta-lactamase superfamily II)